MVKRRVKITFGSMKRVWKTVKCQGKSGKSQGILKLRISGNPDSVLFHQDLGFCSVI